MTNVEFLTTGSLELDKLWNAFLECCQTNGGCCIVEPDFANEIIKACCILHNFVRQRGGINFYDMVTSQLVVDLEVWGTAPRTQGLQVRDYFSEYFMGLGVVTFQYICI